MRNAVELRQLATSARAARVMVLHFTPSEVLEMADAIERVETAEANAQRVAEQYIARANAGAIDLDREPKRYTEALTDAVAKLNALGQKYDALGGYTDKEAEIAWHRAVTARWREACAALDVIVPGASDAMFFGVSNSDDMQRKVDADIAAAALEDTA